MRNIIAFLFIPATLLLAGCGDKNKSVDIQPVKTCRAATSSSVGQLVFPGKVVSDNNVYAAFKVAGRIAALNVKEGDIVRAGQLIGSLDTSDYRVALDAVEAEYNSIKSEADRVIALYEENATTQIAYDKAVYGLKQITAKLQHTRDQLADTRLTAPNGGVVKTVFRRAGEVVGAGMPVVEIVDNGNPLVEINLPASAFAQREDFTGYSCKFDIYPDRSFKLRPFSEQSVANSNQLYAVKLAFDDADRPFPAVGMAATVSILTDDSGDGSMESICIPAAALVGEGADSYIYVVKPDSTLQKVSVKVLRLTASGDAEIIAGTSVNDAEIVAAGAARLRDGMKVRPIPPTSGTNVGNML